MIEEDIDTAEELDLELAAEEPGVARGAVVRGGVVPVPATETPATGETVPGAETKPTPPKGSAEDGTGKFAAVLERYNRIAIVGGPKAGKSTLADSVTDRPRWSSDSIIGTHEWDAMPEAVKAACDGMGTRWVVEGVQVARALRKGLQVDAVVHLRGARDVLSPGQETMAKGVGTVLRDWRAADGGKTPCVDIDPDDPDDDADDATPVRTRGADAVGDTMRHEADGWHVYAGDTHLGGPYKTALKASRRMRMLSRFDRR
jgi:hypothetical protein